VKVHPLFIVGARSARVQSAVLNPNDTVRVPRFHPRTPPGRPLEVGWAQEFARWLWHLFVLPREQAQPWPRWMHRWLGPVVLALARQLEVYNPHSLRSWLLGLVLIDPPRGRWSTPDTGAGSSRRLVGLGALLHHALYPHVTPVAWFIAERLETVALNLARVYAQAHPSARALVLAVAVVLVAVAASTPLGLTDQLIMLAGMWGLTLLIRHLAGYGPGVIMMTFSVIASSRYIWWRLTQTLDLASGFEIFLGTGLLAAECYTWVVMVLGYVQNARPLRRKPLPLPDDRGLWPSVDVYIPTYNEPLKVVKPTVLAALSLDWPADKLAVHILDDGRREQFREFAARCGANYLIRPDNFHAKAGNLNHALQQTSGEFVAIFDCDHIPVGSFLTTTLGWFLRDPKCAMLQTPHHFFSPDPFERNLGTFRRVPNEGNLFYGLIQDGNDLWNAAFFCGSCAVLRRGPLQEVGGIAVETVTEDAHTALKMHRLGYNTAYLRQVLAGGLATESLAGHIGQRIRWARGMAQIFRLDNPLLGKGLSFFQRLCYSNAMLHFFSGIPRLVFLTAPLAYLYFEFHIISAAAATLAAYAVPHLVQSSLANSHLQGRYRHSFWNEAYESVLSWYIALPTTVALINPRLGKFNVTAKGGLVEHDFFDWRISAPYLALVTLNFIGALIAIPRLFIWNSFEADTVAINLIWTLFNLTLLGAVLGVAAETRQVRAAHRVAKKMPAVLHLPDGTHLACETEDFSMLGVGLTTYAVTSLRNGDCVRVGLSAAGREYTFAAQVVVQRLNHIGVQFGDMSITEEQDYVRCTFAAPDAWSDWDRGTQADHPLASFAEVFSFGATGYVRLFESLYTGVITWWRGGRAAA
jgi:cellulose synthase (UDP-forming)